MVYPEDGKGSQLVKEGGVEDGVCQVDLGVGSRRSQTFY